MLTRLHRASYVQDHPRGRLASASYATPSARSPPPPPPCPETSVCVYGAATGSRMSRLTTRAVSLRGNTQIRRRHARDSGLELASRPAAFSWRGTRVFAENTYVVDTRRRGDTAAGRSIPPSAAKSRRGPRTYDDSGAFVVPAPCQHQKKAREDGEALPGGRCALLLASRRQPSQRSRPGCVICACIGVDFRKVAARSADVLRHSAGCNERIPSTLRGTAHTAPLSRALSDRLFPAAAERGRHVV